MHLLAKTGVGEHLKNIDEPAARTVQSIFAFAISVKPTLDRDFAERHLDCTVRVVDDQFDLRR